MPRPPVSVALCTHNGARHIVEQLESILSQTEPVDEVVVSDDDSQDETLALVRAVFESARAPVPRLRILEHRPALGVSANFEAAILACSNELVLLSDQDDIWLPDRVRLTVDAFERRPEVVLVHADAELVDEAGRTIHPSLLDALEVSPAMREQLRTEGAFDWFMRRNMVTGATAAVRRSLAQGAAPFPHEWVHDEWLGLVASATGAIDVLDDPVIRYRQHGANAIGAKKLSFFGKVGRMLEPGYARTQRLLARARVLSERFAVGRPPVSAERASAAHRKYRHELMRAALPRFRPARIPSILRELRTGRYGEFGRGGLDALRDLLQPLKPPG